VSRWSSLPRKPTIHIYFKKQNQKTKNYFFRYVGYDLMEGHRLFEKTAVDHASLQNDMDRLVGEHGAPYIEGIRPQFDPRKTRRYDSYWNWSRQEAMILFYDIVFGRLTDSNIDRSIMQVIVASYKTLVDLNCCIAALHRPHEPLRPATPRDV